MKIAIFTPLKNINFFSRQLCDKNVDVVFVTEDGDNSTYSHDIYHFCRERDSAYHFLSFLNIDLVIVYGWSFLIPVKKFTNIDFYNFHPSLLPKYRGPNPIIHQLINKETYGGVTLHKMNSKFDAGPIYKQKYFKFTKKETNITICIKLMRCITDVLNEFIKAYMDSKRTCKELSLINQDESVSSYYSSKDLELYIIDENFNYEKFLFIYSLKDFMQIKIKINNEIHILVSYSEQEDDYHKIIYLLSDRKVYIRIDMYLGDNSS